ncbi:MAG: two component, sigma54 specific, transcriptional regulator, Fis family [Candidatus Eremiobacteraeota bacterium]|nr:two component, sigma54 specific, transcriptional regulator, Fis family [Candidatus Eremiobacteraeota bacterium]
MTGRPTILVADDNRAVLQALTMLFSDDGWRVLAAESPSALLSRCASDSVDVIVLDMNFQRDTTSGQEGIDLIRQLHLSWPQLPVVLMTAWATVERAVEAMQLGARDYVRKPWDNDRLLAACRTQLALRRANAANEPDAGSDDDMGRSPAIRAVMRMVAAIAPTEASVLIVGEPGTGKELAARAIHERSRRHRGPFVKVHMGALADSLVERELFGHVRGAFTDAGEDRPGRFAAADGGTILLDEIATMTPQHQVKLLRVLQEREYEPLGSTRPIKADVRIIAATNADLKAEIAAGRFRADLFHRLNVVQVALPPLRERADDVLLLADRFLARANARNARSLRGYTEAARAALLRHQWPGNVRELEHAIERAVILAHADFLDEADLAIGAIERSSHPAGGDTLDAVERVAVERALREHAWNVTRAAQALGLTRQALYRRMEKFGFT